MKNKHGARGRTSSRGRGNNDARRTLFQILLSNPKDKKYSGQETVRESRRQLLAVPSHPPLTNCAIARTGDGMENLCDLTRNGPILERLDSGKDG
jgi:hypothetical protein